MENKKQLSEWLFEKFKMQEDKQRARNEKLLKKLNELLFEKDMLDEDGMILDDKFLNGLIELEEFKSEKNKLHDKYINVVMEIINAENQMEGIL